VSCVCVMAQTIVDRSVYVKIENWSEVNML